MATTVAQKLQLRHIVRSQQFTPSVLEELFERTDRVCSLPEAYSERMAGRLMATLFYEPSTRTRLSFEAAMLRLGGRVMGTESAGMFSSAAKGETLEDSIRVVGGYADLIVLRHPEEGAAERAASISPVPVINAGDGAGQHPTQALLDLYTIRAELGRLDNIRLALVGDLKHGRTVRSLTYLMARFPGTELIFVSPPELRLRDDLKQWLSSHQVSWREATELEPVLPQADVVYMTRVQKERFQDPAEYEKVAGCYRLGKEQMAMLGEPSVVLHPLPRTSEIDTAIDSDPRLAIFRQARHGMYVRMALLDMISVR